MLPPPSYTYRPMQRADLPGFRQILLDSREIDDRDYIEAMADLENNWDDPWSNAAADSLAALAPDGALAASIRTFANPDPTVELIAEHWFEIHPAHRGRGLEDYFMAWAEARCLERLRAKPRGAPPLRIRAGAADTLRWRCDLYEQHGYRPIRYFYRMLRDLAQPIPVPQLPAGLTFTRYRPELDHQAYDTMIESFSDHWGFQVFSYEEWRQFFIRRSTCRLDYTWFVLRAGQVVAISLNRVEEDVKHNRLVGWIGQLGTRRAWRKRGLATALLCQAMQTFRDEGGYAYAGLGVDTENLTGALAIYERLGFTPVHRGVNYEKVIE
jgi:GNAT superfamily N-acetyltransferase